MDGEQHYQEAMGYVAMAADPGKEDDPVELLTLANVHMTAALIHAVNPDLARQWSQP